MRRVPVTSVLVLLCCVGCDALTGGGGDEAVANAQAVTNAEAEVPAKGKANEDAPAKAEVKDEPPAAVPTVEPAARAETEDAADAPPVAAAEPATAAAVETRFATPKNTMVVELTPPAAHKHTPGHKASRIEFLGWTPDGRRFAIEVEHGYERVHDAKNFGKFVQVFDALTGVLLELYVLQRDDESTEFTADKNLDKLTKAAGKKNAKKWKKREAELGLVASSPSTRSPDGWKLVVDSEFEPPRGSTFELSDGKWAWKKAAKLDHDKAAKNTPEFTVSLEGPEARVKQMFKGSTGKKTALHVLGGLVSPDSGIEGSFEAYFSPTGERFVLLEHFAGVMDSKEQELRFSRSRWKLRGVGPQVRVVAAGADEAGGRKAAARLHAAGIPVAVLDRKGDEVTASEIYFRGDEGEAIANAVKKALGKSDMPLKPLDEDVFTDVIVLVTR